MAEKKKHEGAIEDMNENIDGVRYDRALSKQEVGPEREREKGAEIVGLVQVNRRPDRFTKYSKYFPEDPKPPKAR
jgi:hypothetical protein